ncbi:MAG: nucleoside recognition domain-containing protein [Candidatus Bipolaricaulota bacterium]
MATVASRGVGLRELLAALPQARPARMPAYAADVEKALGAAAEAAGQSEALRALPRRYAAAQALADARTLGSLHPEEAARVEAARAELAQARGEDPAVILADERHAQAVRLFEAVATVGHARVGWRERLDDLLMHPVLAYPVLLFVLFSLFWTVFRVGSTLEGLFLPHLEAVSHSLAAALGPGLFSRVAVGAFDGLVAGVAIVLPYLVPFLFLLAFFEDVGYLPRVAYLLDGLMHRIGLHGKSVIPLLLGYGCSVPAVMATRILEDERDRVVTAALTLLVPCAAITVVVFGLVGRYVGPTAAFGLYLLNILVVVVVGWGLTRIVPGLGPGLILEIPPYRAPRAVALLGKVWLRLRGFVVLAWPLLIATSAVFAVAEALGWTGALNAAVRFITWPLGLPPQAGVPLVFGVLRKELSLVMLAEAFAPAELATALSVGQMVVFTVFVLFYVPCVATVAALGRELGWRRTGLVILGTTGLALLLGVLARVALIR